MRYGYAVLADHEDELSSSKLFFDRMISIDRFFIDREKDRHKRGALLRTVDQNDEVVVQSSADCGLSRTEIEDLKRKVAARKAVLRFVSDSKFEQQPAGSKTSPGKRRRKLRLNIDEDLFRQLYEKLQRHEIRRSEIARQLGVSWPTLQNRIERYEEEQMQTA